MSKNSSTLYWLKEARRYKERVIILTKEVEDLKQELEVVVADRNELQKEKEKAEHFDLIGKERKYG